MNVNLIKGDSNIDNRGEIFHINNFDLSLVKRIYIIENKSTSQNRGWKGHEIENRWFFCSKGSIQIKVVTIDSFTAKKNINIETFTLTENNLNVLFVPKGHATLIKQVQSKSRIVAMSDYLLGGCNDENLRWQPNFFKT